MFSPRLSLILAAVISLVASPAFAQGSASSVSSKKELNFPIVMYHFVEIVQDKKDVLRRKMAMSPSLFETQLKRLQKQKMTPYFVRDIPAYLAAGVATDHPVALTFDDGYEDFYTYVFPLLKKYQVKATLFVISGRITGGDYLTTTQLKEIATSGLVEIGAHTRTHPRLSKLSLGKQTDEIAGSKKDLETLLGIPVTSFAYPEGDYSAKTVQIVKDAGFTVAVTTDHGTHQSLSHLWTLKRIRAGGFLMGSASTTIKTKTPSTPKGK